MDLKNFKLLEKEIKKQDFSSSYKGINRLLKALSYLGNLGSIFLASFFISKLLGDSVTILQSPVLIWSITLALLISLELLKRDIFDKFSLEFIRYKNIAQKEVAVLTIFAVVLISMSFYSSLNGAQEFSSKNDILETELVNDVSIYTDSITNMYMIDINSIKDDINNKKSEIDKYKLLIDKKDNEQSLINESLQDRGYLYKSENRRNKQLSEEKKDLDKKIFKTESDIDKYLSQINNIESKRDSDIEKYNNESLAEFSDKSGKNKSNSIVFIIISTIIEFLILIGIYFNKNYNFKCYKEYKIKMDSPKFQKWIFYKNIIDVLYMNDLGYNDKLPNNKQIHDFMKMGDIWCSENEINNAIKLFKALKITRTHGPNRLINKDKIESIEILKNHLKLNE